VNNRIRRIILDPLLAHYDKSLTLVALGILIAVVVTLGARTSGEKNKQRVFMDRIQNLNKTVAAGVQTSSRAKFVKGRQALSRPFQLSVSTTNFMIIPEQRVSCKWCRKPIAFSAEKCPFCFREQDVVSTDRAPKDSDADGIPDDWELKHRLNPNDGDDAKIDSDSDGFTNLEEYKSGKALGMEIDPTDKNSVPPAWMYGKLWVKDAKAFEFKLKFMSSMQRSTNELVFAVNHVDTKQTFWKKIGDQVLGFTIVEYTAKILATTNAPGIQSVRNMDISELKLKSADGETLILVKGVPLERLAKSADLYYLPAKQTITVKTGAEFEIQGRKYRVKEIDAQSKKVIVSDVSLNREEIIGPPAAGEL